MATLGSIRAELIADSSKWGKGLDESARGLTKFQKTAVGLFAAVTAAGTAVAAIFTTKVLPQFDKLDEIAKLSRNTGFGTEKLLAYQFAAEQSGVATDTLNNGLKRFVRTSGEARAGVGAAVAGFSNLGISVSQLSQLSLDQQLMMTADAIKALPDPAQKAAAAYKLFGRQGQELLNFLNEGSSGLQRFQNEADGLGLLFGSDDLAKVEAANDAINRFDRSVEAMWQRVAVDAAPAVEKLADKMTLLLQKTDTGPLVEGLGAIGDAVLWVADFTNKWFTVSRGYFTALGALGLKISEILNLQPEGAAKEFIRMRHAADSVADAVRGIPDRVDIDPVKIKLDVEVGAAAGRFKSLLESTRDEIDRLRFGTQKWEQDFEKLVLSGAATKQELQELLGLINERNRLQNQQQAAKDKQEEQKRATEKKAAEEDKRRSLADTIRDRNKSPLDELKDGIGDLFKTKDLLTNDTKALELERLRDEFLDAVQPDDNKDDEPTRFAAAASSGSAAAAAAVVQAIAQSQQNSNTQTAQQQLVGLTKEQATLIQQVNNELAMLNTKVPAGAQLVPVESLDG